MAKGRLEQLIEASPDKKHEIKAREHARCILTPYVIDDIRIEPISQPYIENKDILGVSVRAYIDSTDEELFVDNPLLYKNPPIKVNDQEDVLGALKEIIVQTVKVLNKR